MADAGSISPGAFRFSWGFSGVGEGGVGKHTKLTDKQTRTETKKRTFTDVIKKVKLPRDLLNKVPVE